MAEAVQGEKAKLSALIRKGALMVPEQGVNSWVEFKWSEHADTGEVIDTWYESACALGAACVAVLPSAADYALGVAHVHDDEQGYVLQSLAVAVGYRLEETYIRFPETLSARGGEEMSLLYVVTTLNDEEGWTREAIADWLESQGL